MHKLALILAVASVAINGLALSGLLNEPKTGAYFGGAAALSLVALLVGYDDVTVLAWTLMAATLAAIGVIAIGAHQGRREQALEPGRAKEASGDAPVEWRTRINDAWATSPSSCPQLYPPQRASRLCSTSRTCVLLLGVPYASHRSGLLSGHRCSSRVNGLYDCPPVERL